MHTIPNHKVLVIYQEVFSQSFSPFWGFSGGSEGKESAYNARDMGSISGLEISPGKGNGNPDWATNTFSLGGSVDGGAGEAGQRSKKKRHSLLSSRALLCCYNAIQYNLIRLSRFAFYIDFS